MKKYTRWAVTLLSILLVGGIWSYTCLYEPGELSTLDIVSLIPFYAGYALMIWGLKKEQYRILAAGALCCCLSCMVDLVEVATVSGPVADYIYYLMTAAAYLHVFLAERNRAAAISLSRSAFGLIIARSLLEMITTGNPVVLITLPANMLSHGLPLLLIGKILQQEDVPQPAV